MKKALILVVTGLLLAGCFDVAAQNAPRGRKEVSPFIEGRQKVRESDYATFDRFTPFNTKDTKLYFLAYDYTTFPEVTRKNNPDWGELQPVVNYLASVGRATLTMCAVYAINPELDEKKDPEVLRAQAREEAKEALDAFNVWKTRRELKNKVQYKVAEVDYRYFKGNDYYNEMAADDVIHVGLLLYFGSRKLVIFPPDTTSRTFPDIRFMPNDATILDSWRSTIAEVADYLDKNPRKGVLLTGYSDNRGTAAYCKGVSRQRAMEVKKALQQRGVDPTRIEVEVKGDADPVGDNTTEDYALNNRVSIKIQ